MEGKISHKVQDLRKYCVKPIFSLDRPNFFFLLYHFLHILALNTTKILEYGEIKTEAEFLLKIQNMNHFDELKIVGIPSTLNAGELFTQSWFLKKLCDIPALISVQFIIDEQINDGNLPNVHLYTYMRKFLIAFESSVDSKRHFYWKIDGADKKFHSLKCDHDLLKDYVWNFLMISVRNNLEGKFSLNFSKLIIFKTRLFKAFQV